MQHNSFPSIAGLSCKSAKYQAIKLVYGILQFLIKPLAETGNKLTC
jgi:hypothetical protein